MNAQKNKIAIIFMMNSKKLYSYLICIGLILMSGKNFAQSKSEIAFAKSNLDSDHGENLLNVSALIEAKQSGAGIHFTLVVKNNSGDAISIKNMVDQLSLSLFNERGLDISVPNDAEIELQINRRHRDPAWKFRSESVVAGQASINGRKENVDVKTQEYVQIPSGGSWKIDLTVENVKQVETLEDVANKIFRPTISLMPGRYRLLLFLRINTALQDKSEGFGAGYHTPFIDVEYSGKSLK